MRISVNKLARCLLTLFLTFKRLNERRSWPLIGLKDSIENSALVKWQVPLYATCLQNCFCTLVSGSSVKNKFTLQFLRINLRTFY